MIKLNFKEFWTDHATDDPSPWSSQSNADVAFGATKIQGRKRKL